MTKPVSSNVSGQYENSIPLDTRINFHERFSTNKYPWHRWVFDHFDFSDNARILELGSGVGKLWTENAERINPNWEITLSDFSEGMLASTQTNLAKLKRNFHFQHFSAEEIPNGHILFDAVIANHMLYHTDLDVAIPEIRRVLRPGGTLYASTNGKGHLKGIDELIVAFRGGDPPIQGIFDNFSLDNAADLISSHFSRFEKINQENALQVDDGLSLAQFCMSLSNANIPEGRQAEFSDFVMGFFKRQGHELLIEKNSGLIVAS